MALPGLNFRPGKVVEAEIRRKYGSPVCHNPSSQSSAFFLVISFGRCKFRLSEWNAALILQSVIGGAAGSFGLYALSDRVFRFSVCSSAVGFHIYKLRSFECTSRSSSTSGIMGAQIIFLNIAAGVQRKSRNGPQFPGVVVYRQLHRRHRRSPEPTLFRSGPMIGQFFQILLTVRVFKLAVNQDLLARVLRPAILVPSIKSKMVFWEIVLLGQLVLAIDV